MSRLRIFCNFPCLWDALAGTGRTDGGKPAHATCSGVLFWCRVRFDPAGRGLGTDLAVMSRSHILSMRLVGPSVLKKACQF